MERIISENGRFFGIVERDYFASNPREEYPHITTIVYDSRDYVLGDERVDSGEFELPPNCVALPVYAHIHSGIVLSTSASICALDPQGWDSGQCGLIYVNRDKARKEWGDLTDEQIRKNLAAEVEEFSAYLSGDVYTTSIYRVPEGTDPGDINIDGENPEGVDIEDCELLDSCGGYYSYEGAVEDVKNNLEYYEATTPIQYTLPGVA